MDTIINSHGETGRRLMGSPGKNSFFVCVITFTYLFIYFILPGKNSWCWTWVCAVEMKGNRQIADVLRRQNKYTLFVIKGRELQGQLSGQWLCFQKENTVKEQVQGEGHEAALEMLRSRSP